MRSQPICAALLVSLVGAAGCSPRSPYDLQRDNPLGPSFWLNPAPSDDDGLLGRTFLKPPDTALTLEEQSRPNPCADKLLAAKLAEAPNKYENAIDVKSSASGGALLSLFGFSADFSSATHLVYKVNTQKKLTRLDTSEYETCCKTNQCGWGYVSSLIFGEGEYASAQETSASAGGSYTVVTLRGSTSFKILNKKDIKGFLAAVITAHDRSAAAQACSPDQEWLAVECVDKGVAARQRGWCAEDGSKDPMWKDDPEMRRMEKEQQDRACRWLDDHKLPRP
jgi:hypothetical protein